MTTILVVMRAIFDSWQVCRMNCPYTMYVQTSFVHVCTFCKQTNSAINALWATWINMLVWLVFGYCCVADSSVWSIFFLYMLSKKILTRSSHAHSQNGLAVFGKIISTVHKKDYITLYRSHCMLYECITHACIYDC